MKSIFEDYTGSKNQVQNRLKIQFVELDLSKLIFQKSSTDQQGVSYENSKFSTSFFYSMCNFKFSEDVVVSFQKLHFFAETLKDVLHILMLCKYLYIYIIQYFNMSFKNGRKFEVNMAKKYLPQGNLSNYIRVRDCGQTNSVYD